MNKAFKITNLFLFLLLLTHLLCCKQSIADKYLVKTKWAGERDKYSFKTDSIRIPISKSYSHVYFTYALYHAGQTDYFIGYNPKNASIDVYNLSKRTPVKQIELRKDSTFINKLDKQDLDKGRSITDICVVNLDSIIVNLSNQQLIVLDTSVRKKRVLRLDQLGYRNNIAAFPISYSTYFKMTALNNKLLMNLIYADDDWVKKRPCFALLDVKEEKLVPLPLYYSDYFYHINGKTGFLGHINVSEFQKSGLITYNYLYESNIYQYNPTDSMITCYGASTSHGRNLVEPFIFRDGDNLKNWEIHNIESMQFFNVMYDEFRDVYYRFSLRNINYRNGRYFNSVLEKPLVLMIFNKNFEVIKEIELPLYLYAANTWFVTAEGLFISATNQKKENIDPGFLTYHIFKLSKDQQEK